MIPASRLIEEARRLLGTPWLHQGRGPAGIDCVGFADLVSKRAGYDVSEQLGIKDTAAYGRLPTENLLTIANEHFTRIETPVNGALMLFQIKGPYPFHVGFYADGNVIHALETRGKVVEHGLRMKWARDWLHSVWLMPGFSYE